MNLENTKLNEVLDYEQPTKYIVETTEYDDSFETPVLTAGKSFLLGYTNDKTGIFMDVPAIIFDDFTTSFHYVDFPFKVKSSAMKILTPKEDFVDLKYVYLQMQQVRIDTQLHKRYWISKFSNKEIPVPKVDIQNKNTKTQQRIAAILDNAAALRDKTAQLLTEYDLLAQSIFLEMFGDPVLNPKEWKKSKTIDYCQCIVPGRDKPKSFTGNTPWVTTNDLIHLGFTDSSKIEKGLSKNEIDQVRAKVIPVDSVILTCVGDLGIVTVIKKEMVVNQQLHTFQCSDEINSVFLMYNLSFQKPYMHKMASSTTVPYMNKTIANGIPTIVPPIELQNQFAEKIALIEQQKALAKQELQESEDLFNCLLQQAFKGEL
jgi:type I restriction enzyme S subunit